MAAHVEANSSIRLACQGIEKDDGGQVSALTGELHLEGSVKTTKLKLTWLPQARHLSLHGGRVFQAITSVQSGGGALGSQVALQAEACC